MIEVQMKTITSGTWPLGSKGTVGALTDREWYVFVLLGRFPERPRTWVVPRDHVAAATWIAHMSWLTDPTANPGRGTPESAAHASRAAPSHVRRPLGLAGRVCL
jgi:hypothetical protein